MPIDSIYKQLFKLFILLIYSFPVFFMCLTGLCFGQDAFTDKQIEINKITLSGNANVDAYEILSMFNTKESPGKFSKFLYGIFGEKFGSKPEYFFPVIFNSDIERLYQYYNEYGFFNAKITTTFSLNSDSTFVDVNILISENIRAVIDTIVYNGLDNCDPKILEQVLKDPIIKKGSPYQKSRINDEAYRILGIVTNNGYSFATILSDSSSALRYVSSNKVKVIYCFQTRQQYKFGKIKISVIPQRNDITENIVYKQLDFKTGDLVSKDKIFSSEKSLNKLSVFEAARIEVAQDSAAVFSKDLPVNIIVRPRNKHELAPELVISDEDNTFNFGVGAGYTNYNFLGDARTFNSRIRLSTQSIQEWNFHRIFGKGGLADPSILGKVEVQLQLTQPSLFTKTLNGQWTFSLSADKKNFYAVTIARNKIGLINRFATYTTGYFDWTLERSNVNWLQDTLITGLSLSRLKEEEQPQFNSIFTFTLQRDKTNDVFSPTEGFFHALSVEESGMLQSAFKNIQPTLPFTQFYKFTLLGRWYQDISRTKFNILAVKLKAGYQDKYGQSKTNPNRLIPLNRRFFAGGSGSVRAWKTRTLGAMPLNEIQLGGNFIFEGNNELRVNHLRGFDKLWFLNLENFWGVYFIDYGNVWTDINKFRIKDIAVGAGVGVRYDTFVGPVRLDFGFRVYDPNEVEGKKIFISKRFFKDVLNNGSFNIGIGQAF
jgi:outer membrane protein insertion porin family